MSWCIADLQQGVIESRLEHWPPVTSAVTPWLGDAIRLPRHAPPADEGWRILLLGDPPTAADALVFIYALGILHVAGIPATAMIPRGAARLDRALRHIQAGGYLHALELLDAPPLALLDRAHLAMSIPVRLDEETAVTEPSFASKLCIGAATAAGLPVVMQDSPWARGLLPDGAHACMAPSIDAAKLARATSTLLNGPGLAQAGAALAQGVNAPARSLPDEVVQAWGISTLAGAAR
jgi:hypothetical protein